VGFVTLGWIMLG